MGKEDFILRGRRKKEIKRNLSYVVREQNGAKRTTIFSHKKGATGQDKMERLERSTSNPAGHKKGGGGERKRKGHVQEKN